MYNRASIKQQFIWHILHEKKKKTWGTSKDVWNRLCVCNEAIVYSLFQGTQFGNYNSLVLIGLLQNHCRYNLGYRADVLISSAFRSEHGNDLCNLFSFQKKELGYLVCHTRNMGAGKEAYHAYNQSKIPNLSFFLLTMFPLINSESLEYSTHVY